VLSLYTIQAGSLVPCVASDRTIGGVAGNWTRLLTSLWCVICLAGIDHYYSCVGSKPGYCDAKAYVESTELQTCTGPQDDLRLKDGQLIYVSVQVRYRSRSTVVILFSH